MSINKEGLLEKLSEAQRVLLYYLESVQQESLEPSKVHVPEDELVKVSTLIHSHITKVGIVFKPIILESTYKACSEEVSTLVKNISLLAALMGQFQKSLDKYSKLYVSELIKQFKLVINTVNSLFKELVNVLDLEEDSESGERLIDVGKVWECCDSLKKLAKDGSSGVLKIKLLESNKLVVDGLEELEEWNKDPQLMNDDPFDFSDDEGDANDAAAPVDQSNGSDDEIDSELIAFSNKWTMKIKLIKLLMSTLNKSIPAPTVSIKFATTIDSLNDRRLELNEYIDELIGSIIFDIDLESAKSASNDLTKCVNSVIQLVSKLNNDDEKKIKWLTTWKVKFLEDIK